MKEVNGKERKTNTHRENFDSERSFEGKESRERRRRRKGEMKFITLWDRDPSLRERAMRE